jgi:very-short-patch-repair endonuclease
MNKQEYVYKYPNAEIPSPGSIKKEMIEKYGQLWWDEKERRRKYGNSLIGFIERYGETNGKQKWEDRYKKQAEKMIGRNFNIKYYIDLYGEEKGLEIWNTKNKNISKSKKELKCGTKEFFINKYGEETGCVKYNSYIQKCKTRHTLEGFITRHGEEVGLEKYNTFVNKSKVTLDNMIIRYGKEEGIIRYNEYKMKQKENSHFSFGWWVKKFDNDIEKAKEEYKKFQTRNKSWFIERYGESEGINNYESWIEKATTFNCSPSKISQEFFTEMERYLNISDGEYSGKNGEARIGKYNIDYRRGYKIIEFNGDFYHMNPRIYDSNDYNPKIGKKADNIWEYDRNRKKFLEDKGNNVLIIWEMDVIEDRENVFKICKKFLLED